MTAIAGPGGSPSDPRATLAEEVNPASLPIFLGALICSCLGAFWLQGTRQTEAPFPWAALAANGLAAVLLGLGIAIALGKEETARHGWATFLGLFAFLAGPVGVVLGILAYLVARGQPTRTPLTEVVKAEMFATVLPDEEPEEFHSMELRIREQAEVEPFVDMLPVADVATTIAILNRLKERGQRRDLELIRKVTADPRPEVYQYALAILDKAEKGFAARVFALQQEIALHPRRASLRVDMAKLHLEYLQSGLLDDSLCDYYWELSLSHLFEAILAAPGHPELGADLAQLLAIRGLVAEAGAVASQALKKNPALLPAQLLVVQAMYEKALEEGSTSRLLAARRSALESAWALKLPRTRGNDLGLTFDLAHFWFGDRDA